MALLHQVARKLSQPRGTDEIPWQTQLQNLAMTKELQAMHEMKEELVARRREGDRHDKVGVRVRACVQLILNTLNHPFEDA